MVMEKDPQIVRLVLEFIGLSRVLYRLFLLIVKLSRLASMSYFFWKREFNHNFDIVTRLFSCPWLRVYAMPLRYCGEEMHIQGYTCPSIPRPFTKEFKCRCHSGLLFPFVLISC